MMYNVILASELQPGDVVLFHKEDVTVESVERAGRSSWAVSFTNGASANFTTTVAVQQSSGAASTEIGAAVPSTRGSTSSARMSPHAA